MGINEAKKEMPNHSKTVQTAIPYYISGNVNIAMTLVVLKPHIRSDGSAWEMSYVTSKFYRRQLGNAPGHETKRFGGTVSACMLLHGAIRISFPKARDVTTHHSVSRTDPVQYMQSPVSNLGIAWTFSCQYEVELIVPLCRTHSDTPLTPFHQPCRDVYFERIKLSNTS